MASASPMAYSPATPARSKRSASISSSDYGGEVQPVSKKRAGKKSSRADVEQKKDERMERNRKAAQASRDRKKLHQEHLEVRIAQLEQQLAMAHVAAPASNTSNLAPRHVASTSASSSASPCSPSLEEENAALRTQLQLEQLQSAALKVRLGALETKFARLDELLRGDSAAVAVALPPLHTPPTTTTATFTPSHLSPLPALPTLSPLPPSSSDLNSTRGRFIPAAEAVAPVSLLSSSSSSFHPSLLSSFDDPSTLTASNPLLHLDSKPQFDDYTVSNAWNEWALGLELNPGGGQEVVAGGGAFEWGSALLGDDGGEQEETGFAGGDVVDDDDGGLFAWVQAEAVPAL